VGRKAARRRECKAGQRRGYKIVSSRAHRGARKPTIRRTAARAIPKAQDLRAVALKVVVVRAGILRVAVRRAGALRVGVRRAGALRVAVRRAGALRVGVRRAGALRPGVRRAVAFRPGSAVLKGGLNNPPPSPTLNNLTLSNPRSGLPT
jgi:hypothetical protein